MFVAKLLGKNGDNIRMTCTALVHLGVKEDKKKRLMQCTVINSSSDYISAFLLKFDEGIKFAKTVVAMGDEKELSSRGYLALGMGYSLLASEGNVLVVLGSTLSREWGNGSEQFMTLSNT